MDSRVSLLAAGALILSAVFVGSWALKMGKAPPAEAKVEQQSTAQPSGLAELSTDLKSASIVVLLKDVPIYHPLTAEDVVLHQVPVAPPGSFTALDQVIGQSVQMPLAAGSWLSQDAFDIGGKLAHLIRADERAVAIPVDEVIATGGHLRPGDYVDVLLHMNKSDQSSGRAEETSQVVLQALRVLTFGSRVARAKDSQSVPPEAEKDPSGLGRSVVLAVPAPLVNRLLLASQAGSLRLAVRSADEQLAGLTAEQANELAAQPSALLRLQNLTGSDARPPALNRVANPTPRARSVEVIRGTESIRQTP